MIEPYRRWRIGLLCMWIASGVAVLTVLALLAVQSVSQGGA